MSKVFFRMEKAHNHGCASIDGKLCYYALEKNKCPHVNQYLVCINKDIVFIADTIIPQKLALYDEMLEAIKSIDWGRDPYTDESGHICVKLHCWRNLKSIIDRAKKIEEAT